MRKSSKMKRSRKRRRRRRRTKRRKKQRTRRGKKRRKKRRKSKRKGRRKKRRKRGKRRKRRMIKRRKKLPPAVRPVLQFQPSRGSGLQMTIDRRKRGAKEKRENHRKGRDGLLSPKKGALMRSH